VVLRRLFFFFALVDESAGTLVTLESDEEVELTVSEVSAPVLFRSPLAWAALSGAPLPPTAVPAGG